MLPDADGVVRRLPLVFNLGKGLVPGTAAEAVRLLDGQRRHHLSSATSAIP